MRDTTNLILLYLSVSDFVISILAVLQHISNLVYCWNNYLSFTFDLLYITLFGYIKLVCLFTSTYFVTMLSVERMIAVCFPFHVSRIVTKFRIKVLAVLITFLLSGLLSPYCGLIYLSYSTKDYVLFIGTVQIEFFQNNYSFFADFYLSIFVNIYSMAIPTIIVLLFKIMTIKKLARTSRNLNGLYENVMSKRVKELRSLKIVEDLGLEGLNESDVLDLLEADREPPP
ncbi:hypothetical protein Btru_049381 [Bulinus truncatus]|nr:hypothetical protein Btru_049381 [Bulinus truncatus]